jgi:long-chain acyl-CoA synthetase
MMTMTKTRTTVSKACYRLYDRDIATTLRYPQFPVQNLVHIAAVAFPQKEAINMYGTGMTFAELRGKMLRMANALTRLGISKGDPVGLSLLNCPQYIIAYYAVLSLGAIVVNLNPAYDRDELKIMIDKVRIKALIAIDSSLPTFRPLVKELSIELVIIAKLTDFIEEFETSTARSLGLDEGWHHFSELIAECSDVRLPQVIITPQDLAMIQYTGGTTGISKAVALTHGNIIASVCQFSAWSASLLKLKSYEIKVIGVLPYFEVYGNIICMNWSLFNTMTQILLPMFETNEFINIASKFKEPVFFPTVPSMIKTIINHPQANDCIEHGPIRWIHSVGAPMPVDIIRQLKESGILYSEGWGMTETTAMGICNPILGGREGSIGIPVMDTDVRLIDLSIGLHEVKPGEPGEIIIKGPTIMQGYWNEPDATADRIRDEWLYTGDIAEIDSDGYFYFVDRKKEMIINDGFQIYPREVNAVLKQHPMVAEAVTVGIPDGFRGEIVKAYVVLNLGDIATEKDIIDYCKSKLASCKVPKVVEFRESLPKSGLGKILLRSL